MKQEELQNLANKLTTMGLAQPAALLLRTLSPLGVALSQGLLFLEPFLGPGRLRDYARIFEDEETLASFVSLLER